MYRVVFTRQADKDKPLLKRAGLETRAKALLDVLREDPFTNPPPYEKLSGDMQGLYSRRINVQHRLVYAVEVGIPKGFQVGLTGRPRTVELKIRAPRH